MKKVLSLIMVLALILVCFAACTGGGEPKDNNKDNSSAAAPSAEDSTDASTSEDKDNAPESTPVEPDTNGGATDAGLCDTWEVTEDGITVAITFNADGTGKMETLGMTMDIAWSVTDGKLNASASLMGETEEMFKDAEYSIDGDTLTVTQEDESMVLTRKGGSGNSGTTLPGGTGGDDALVGSWEVTEDGITMVLNFEEDGKGNMESVGVSMDMAWSVTDGKLSASMSFMGETEELFAGADYTVDGDKLTVTIDGESLVLTKK